MTAGPNSWTHIVIGVLPLPTTIGWVDVLGLGNVEIAAFQADPRRPSGH